MYFIINSPNKLLKYKEELDKIQEDHAKKKKKEIYPL